MDAVMPAKIVHVISSLGRGGAERQLLHLSGELHRRGWPQAVISFGGGDAWNHQLAEQGIPLHEIPRHPFKPWRLWQLSRLLRKERPAIIHSWSAHVAEYARWAWGKGAARTLFGIRIDLTVDANTGQQIRRVPFVGALEHSDYAVSNSRLAIEMLRQRGVKMPPSEVIGNIVIPRGEAVPAAPVDSPRMVAIGTLIRRKGYDCLLRAAGILAAEGKRFELLVAGDGPERPDLERLASELKLSHCVRFLGSYEDVQGLLAGAHIMAHPSMREGLSNTILEGMAQGLPVVSTWQCASEIIEDGRTGLLVPMGQPDALAAALRRLLEDPTLRGRLGKAALGNIEQHCSADAITGAYERVYRSLLGDR
jgi:glycosyltransferase involved in cell wall biosynthesis